MSKKNTASNEVAEQVAAPVVVTGSYVDIDPMTLEIPTDPKERGRYKSPTADEIKHRAWTMIQEGQLQAIRVYPKPEGGYSIVFGFTRAEAAQMIVNGFDYLAPDSKGTPKHYSNPKFKIRAEVVNGTEKETRLANMIENIGRSELTAIDHAHNMQGMMDDFGYKQAKLCELYGWHKSKISRTLSLLDLPSKVQDMIHTGVVPETVGVELVKSSNKLDEDEILALVEKYGNDLTVAVVQEYVRTRDAAPADAAEETADTGSAGGSDDDDTDADEGGTAKRTRKQIVDLLTNFVNKQWKKDFPELYRAMAAVYAYSEGQIEEGKAMDNVRLAALKLYLDNDDSTDTDDDTPAKGGGKK